MNSYEKLLSSTDENLIVIEKHFKSKAKGLCRGNKIGISKDIDTITEKACILAEELGHHCTTVGNIIDMSIDWNRKQERQARFHAYEKLIGLMNLIKAYEAGCKNRYEIADYLEVTEEFLQDCIDCYRDKYGIGTQVGEYYVMFIPYLSIGKRI